MSKVIRWVLYAAIVVSFFAAMVFTIDLGFFQLSPFRILVCLLSVLIIVGLCVERKNPLRIFTSKRHNTYSLCFMIAWFVYAAVSLLWTPDLGSGVRTLYFLGSGVLCSVAFSLYFDKKEYFPILFRCMMVMVALHNLMGWYEVIFRNYHFLSPANAAHYSTSSRRIPISWTGNPNNFALLMLFGIFICFICYRCRRKKWEGIASIAIGISSLVLALMTQSRAVLLGLIMSAAFYIIVVFRPKPKHLAILAGAAAVIALLIPNIRESLFSLFRFDFKAGEMNSNSTRINLILNGFYFLGRTFGIGTGAGGVESWMAASPAFPTEGIFNMHNWWMQVLTEFGVLIFAAYLIFYVKLFRDLYHGMRSTDDPTVKSICLGLLCCMVGFILGGISPSSVMGMEWLWVFWAVAIAFQGCCRRPISNNLRSTNSGAYG